MEEKEVGGLTGYWKGRPGTRDPTRPPWFLQQEGKEDRLKAGGGAGRSFHPDSEAVGRGRAGAAGAPEKGEGPGDGAAISRASALPQSGDPKQMLISLSSAKSISAPRE